VRRMKDEGTRARPRATAAPTRQPRSSPQRNQERPRPRSLGSKQRYSRVVILSLFHINPAVFCRVAPQLRGSRSVSVTRQMPAMRGATVAVVAVLVSISHLAPARAAPVVAPWHRAPPPVVDCNPKVSTHVPRRWPTGRAPALTCVCAHLGLAAGGVSGGNTVP
jgi:hypothetical protein